MRLSVLFVCLALGSFVCTLGCEPKKRAAKADAHGHDDDAHAGHDHSAPGPNGGHVEAFEETHSHFEWAHDDTSHKLSIFLEELVAAGAKVESARIDVISGSDTKSFTLDKDEKAKIADSVYSIVSQELMGLIDASGTDAKGVQSKLIVKIDGKDQTCLLKPDDGHKH